MTITEPARSAPAPLARTIGFVRKIWDQPNGALAITIVTLLVVVVAFAPWVAPHDPAAQDVVRRLEGPSTTYLLGTDHLGRDLLSRVIFGARIALRVAVPAVLIAMVGGLLLGLTAGYIGGRVDNLLVVLMDTLQAFPAVILALALLALLGPSLNNVVLVVAVAFTTGYARVARASVMKIKNDPFVQAERSLGASDVRILFVHILPNIIAPLFVLMAIDLPVAVTIEAGLSFLGLGVPPPAPSWGVLLSDGFRRIREVPWPVLAPGAALILTTLGFTLFGEALRDRLDPSVRDARSETV